MAPASSSSYRSARSRNSHYHKQHEASTAQPPAYRARHGTDPAQPNPQLANAYSALATELTKTEIRTIGGYSLGRLIGEGPLGWGAPTH